MSFFFWPYEPKTLLHVGQVNLTFFLTLRLRLVLAFFFLPGLATYLIKRKCIYLFLEKKVY